METFLSLLLALVKRIITAKVFDKVAMLALREAAKSTTNKVDDEVCKIVGDALGIPCDL